MSRNFVILSVVVSFAVLSLCVVPCSATNILLNGDFEIGSSTSVALPVGETSALPNWTVVGTGDWYYDINPGSFSPEFPAESGNVKLLAAGGPNCTLTSDAFAVTGGTTYTVSYWERERASEGTKLLYTTITGPGGMQLTATQGNMDSFTGSGTNTLTWTQSSTQTTWTNYTATFVPSTSGNVTLAFSNNNGGNYGLALDNASVTGSGGTIPEPGTLALLTAGLAGLLCYAWRKRR